MRVRGGPSAEGSPRGVWGDRGVLFSLLSLKFYFPASPALEGAFWKLPASPASRSRGSFAVIRGNQGAGAAAQTPTQPPGRTQEGVGFLSLGCLLPLSVFHIFTRMPCRISMLGTGKVLRRFLSQKAFCYLWCEGLMASGKLVGTFSGLAVFITTIFFPPSPSRIFLRTLVPFVMI